MKLLNTKICLVVSLFLSTNIYAQNWGEAQSLSRLVEHLEASKRLLAQAKAARNDQNRLQFDYESLENNISEMQIGINIYLEKPLEPRDFDIISNLFSKYETQKEHSNVK
jgi:RAQPRD family integrative conjugative element protein